MDTKTPRKTIYSLVFLGSFFTFTAALANPEGGHVVAGQATISSPDANTLHIHQSSDKAVVNWRTFNIGAHENTEFHQPSRNSVILNRVDPNNGSSKIFGGLKANGNVWIVNPAGIFFGSTARVDAAGLVATTANITNENFMVGNFRFTQSPDWHGSVINEGKISIAEKGLAALVAPGVENRGMINAKLGTVVLAAGNGFTIDFFGDGLIQFGNHEQVTSVAYDEQGNPMRNGVSNTGKIIADAGTVRISAHVAEKIVENTINMQGYTQAKTAEQKGGAIILSGGDEGIVRVAGKLNASGKQQGEHGGTIQFTGKKILIEQSKIDASGDKKGGTVLIGGDYQGKNSLVPNADYAYISSAAKIKADALSEGDGGKIIVWSDKATKFYGDISAQGGKVSGNGGFVETSGKEFLEAHGKVNASAQNGKAGTWLLDPTNINITTAADSRGNFNGGNPNIFTPNATGTANADADTIIASLNAGTNVTIQTASSALQAGNIAIQTPINVNVGGSGTATLTLLADGNITFSNANNTITALSGILNVAFNAVGNTTIGAAINTNGGYFNNTSNAFTVNSAINTNGGNFTNNSTTLNLNSSVTTNGGAFNSTTQNTTTLGNGAGTTPGVVNTGSGIITFLVNADNLGANNFVMNLNSALSTTNATADAVKIQVNNAVAGNGSGSATLRDIATGNGGTVTVSTDTGNNTTGSDINYGGTGVVDVGTGTINLTTPKIAGNAIGASANPLQIKAGTLNATTGSSGIYVANSGSTPLTVNTLHAERTDTNAAGVAQIISNTAIQQGSNPVYVSTLTLKTLNDMGANIIFNNVNNAATTVNLQSRNLADTANSNGLINYTDKDGFNITGLLTQANANLIANGAITDSGTTGAVIGGTLTLNSGSANDITLNSAPNDFNKVSVGSANNVLLTDVNGIDLGSFNIENNLTVTTRDAVTQSGALVSNSGTGLLNVTTRNDIGANITLNNPNNEFATITLQTRNAANNANAQGMIQYHDATGFDLNAIRTAGDATFTAGGNITDSGALTIGGLASFTAGANDITLNNANNNFNTVKINSANNATIRDTNSIVLDTSTLTNSLSIIADNDVTQVGALSVPNLTVKTLNNAGGLITLANPENNVATIDIQARNAADTAFSAGAINFVNSGGFDAKNIGTLSTINLIALNGVITENGTIISATSVNNASSIPAPVVNVAMVFPESNYQTTALTNELNISGSLPGNDTVQPTMQSSVQSSRQSSRQSSSHITQLHIPKISLPFSVTQFLPSLAMSIPKLPHYMMSMSLGKMEEVPGFRAFYFINLAGFIALIGFSMRKLRFPRKVNAPVVSDFSFNLRTLLNNIAGFSELLYNQKLNEISDSQKESLAHIINSSNELKKYLSDNVKEPEEMISASSFQLKTLLDIIMGFNQLIQEEKMGQLSLVNRDYINDILSSSQQVTDLINNLSAQVNKPKAEPITEVL